MSEPILLAEYRRAKKPVHFTRHELARILNVYSRRVARGEWRDYAIDHEPGMAMFSIFRSSFERPLYSIIKAHKTGGWVLISGRQKLKQARALEDVLEYLERKLALVAS